MAVTALTYKYIQASDVWAADANMPVATYNGSSTSDGGSNNYYAISFCGTDGGGLSSATYKKTVSSWTTEGSSSIGTRQDSCVAKLANFMYSFGGRSGGTASTYTEKFNGTTWSSFTAGSLVDSSGNGGANLTTNNLIYFNVGYTNSAGNNANLSFSLNSSETSASTTASGVLVRQFCNVQIKTLAKIYKFSGFTSGAVETASNVVLNSSWNGTSWAVETVVPAAVANAACVGGLSSVKFFGGNNTAAAALSAVRQWNGVSWTSLQAYPQSPSRASAGSF